MLVILLCLQRSWVFLEISCLQARTIENHTSIYSVFGPRIHTFLTEDLTGCLKVCNRSFDCFALYFAFETLLGQLLLVFSIEQWSSRR